MESMILEWKEVATATLPELAQIVGEEVLGYNSAWICTDFNPKGIRACAIIADDSPEHTDDWVSSKWDNDQDSWFAVDEAPTHYARIPTFDPSMLKGAQG